MHRNMRAIAAVGFLGCTTGAIMPLGCGGIEQGPPPRLAASNDRRIPAITEERLRECVKEYADQLEEQPYGINAKIEVDDAGRTQKVILEGIPHTAPDFAACTKIALRDMAVPSSVLRLRPGDVVGSTNGQTVLPGNELGNALVVGIFILVGELALEYGGYTILFTVTVGLATAAAKDIAETLKQEDEGNQQCEAELTACLLTPLADLDGHIHGSSRCVMCYDGCRANNGVWPFRMMKGKRWASCQYR